MKLYYLLISMFFIKTINAYNFLYLILGYQFLKHIEYRVPQLLKVYKNSKILLYSKKCFSIKNNIIESNILDKIRNYCITSRFGQLLSFIYFLFEHFYILLLNEIFLMFSNILMNTVTLLISTMNSDKKKSSFFTVLVNNILNNKLEPDQEKTDSDKLNMFFNESNDINNTLGLTRKETDEVNRYFKESNDIIIDKLTLHKRRTVPDEVNQYFKESNDFKNKLSYDKTETKEMGQLFMRDILSRIKKVNNISPKYL